MVGIKEICTLLLAGGIGAGSVVTVQTAVPAVKKMSAPKAGVHSAGRKPTVRRAAAQPSALNDCPSQLALLGKDMVLPPLPPIDVAPGLPLAETAMRFASGGGATTPGFGGFDFTPAPPTSGEGGGIAVGVPEAGTWAMLIMGFGLIGVAMRRSAKPEIRHSDAS